MDFKKVIYSWQSVVLVSLFFLVWSIASAYDNLAWWLLFVFVAIMLIPDAIKNGRS